MIRFYVLPIILLLSVTGPVVHAQDRTLAGPKAVVKSGRYVRFTLLTPGTVRMEWDSTGVFNDYASQVVINRNLPVPVFSTSTSDGWLTIRTQALEIRYKENSGRFDSTNLSIKGHTFTWIPGTVQKGNLKGTSRTLDGYDGDSSRYSKTRLELEDGLLSKDGWYFLDDSKSLLFDKSDWPWVKERVNNNAQDYYFMGYGHDYKTALHDFTLIAGKVPLPPRYAFGYWWSRYWKYSDNELRDLLANFKRYNIPLDVLVIDMDWHKNLDNDGWTGWTFDEGLFTNPAQFLAWANNQGLKITMNLHPASGVAPAEPAYPAVAREMNFDTTGHKTIPYQGSSKKFMQSLFNQVLHPYEGQGIGFWWLDWQQWPYDKAIPSLSNTWWLNYVFFTEMERHSAGRPLLYHRWGGLGNHRYQTGFSGDTYITWKSLEFQPYFTNTASNVLYDYWSHDIGGHQAAVSHYEIEPELYVRWMQYGALSPIFRTHSSKNPRLNKEIWNFKGEQFEALSNAVRLRYTLAPYIYTMARETYDSGIALCRPLYYDYPENQEAYAFSREYQFGDNMLVAPIGAPMTNGVSDVKVWLPGGSDWYEWNTGTLLKGGQVADRTFTLSEYPIYIKAGAIVPMYPEVNNLKKNPHQMIIGIFPGGVSASAKIYEDAGDSKNYDKEYAITPVKTALHGRVLNVTVSPRTGSYAGMEATRDYQIKLYGSEMPVSVYVNGNRISFSGTASPREVDWTYNGSELSVNIHIPSVVCSSQTNIRVEYSQTEAVDVNNGLVEKMKTLSKATLGLKYRNADLLIPTSIGSAEELNRALEYYPGKFYELINSFNENYNQIPVHVREMNLKKEDETWYLQALGF